MQRFPMLKETQVALSRADVNTGIVLDELNNYAVNDNQTVFTIFEDAIQALNTAKLIIAGNKKVECYIHDKDHKLLYFLNSGNSSRP
ncbi:hypothetical protein BDD43_4418 [Mucilaginibacter gracilis]|uniref:Uncharacterized protein n=1 Tax=Mucilaginibacter gracilis TaxID=423350 RepID=A0A495J644_9SPHI|nr:hypothetical protein [Mucilaginibacter gracilis]RKR84191.1 hypothetical protein BDD43_4418 [Mucilaginibacter gracilis]